MAKLHVGYLFPEINRRKRKLMEKNPDARVISLGVGDTTEPLMPHITQGLAQTAEGLGTRGGYMGYADEQGLTELRVAIADRVYGGKVKADEVFISDGAKSDIGRLQVLFGPKLTIAVQDPSYPVYVDGSVIVGATGEYSRENGRFDRIVYLECTPENDFFPDLTNTPKTDLIYFCSPNNPTGAVATKKQLAALVDFAHANNSIILYDAAYSEFIRDKKLPKTIYDIGGAMETAIEINSFSKRVGFTGVRLGWTVIPEQLTYDDGTQVIKDWGRVSSTVFNGASNIAQMGGLAALDDEGLTEMNSTIGYYLENAKIIKRTLDELGVKAYGGVNAPYIWAQFKNRKSWDVFEEILEKAHVVTTPGCGFGPAGEGFIRFSAFGRREDILEAAERLKTKLNK